MGLIPEETIRQVLDHADIVAIISATVGLKKAGRNFKACCPFHHEKTPSFIVNPDKQIFHCFGCHVGGNVISFVMHHDRVDFPEAVRSLASRYSIEIPRGQEDVSRSNMRQDLREIQALAGRSFHNAILTSKSNEAQSARSYLKARGLDLTAVRQFQLGYASTAWDDLLQDLRQRGVSLGQMEQAGLIIAQPKGEGYYDRFRNRIMFPILDIKDRIIAFGGRTLENENPAKYINSPETSVYSKGHHLYGLNWSKHNIAKQDCAIVVEGYLDFIVPFQAGVKNIVASLGTALTLEQIRLLRRFTHNIVMLFDTDKAGESAMIRSLDLLLAEGMQVKVATLTEGEDPDSFVRGQGVEAFVERIQQAETLFDYKLRMLIEQSGDRSIEARAQVSAVMLETIDKFQSSVVQAEYVKMLAQRLSLSFDALVAEFSKVRTRGARQDSRSDSDNRKPESIHIRPLERDLIRLLLHEQEFIPITQQEVELTDFLSDIARHIVAKIFEIFERNQQVSIAELMSCFEDSRTLQAISKLASEDEWPKTNTEKFHQDCLARFKQDRIKMIRKDLMRQMENAHRCGDNSKMEELTLRFNQLIKR